MSMAGLVAHKCMGVELFCIPPFAGSRIDLTNRLNWWSDILTVMRFRCFIEMWSALAIPLKPCSQYMTLHGAMRFHECNRKKSFPCQSQASHEKSFSPDKCYSRCPKLDNMIGWTSSMNNLWLNTESVHLWCWSWDQFYFSVTLMLAMPCWHQHYNVVNPAVHFNMLL